jgi:hypothetical protein
LRPVRARDLPEPRDLGGADNTSGKQTRCPDADRFLAGNNGDVAVQRCGADARAGATQRPEEIARVRQWLGDSNACADRQGNEKVLSLVRHHYECPRRSRLVFSLSGKGLRLLGQHRREHEKQQDDGRLRDAPDHGPAPWLAGGV